MQDNARGKARAQDAGAAPVSVPVNNKRWYVVHVYSVGKTLRELNLRTVPQVFVNSIHLGGLHSLIKLDAPALQNLLGT